SLAPPKGSVGPVRPIDWPPRSLTAGAAKPSVMSVGCCLRSRLSGLLKGDCHGIEILASNPARTTRQDGPAIQVCPWEKTQRQYNARRNALQALARQLRRAYPARDQSERPCLGSGHAGDGHEAVCRSTGLSLFRPDTHLRRYRSALSRFR